MIDRREYRFEDGSVVWLTRGEHKKLMAGWGIDYDSVYEGICRYGWLQRDRVSQRGRSFPAVFRWQNEPGKDTEMNQKELNEIEKLQLEERRIRAENELFYAKQERQRIADIKNHQPHLAAQEKNMSKETITDAIINGGKMAAADAAGDVLLSGAQLLLKDSPASALLADENGQAVVKLLMGMGLVYMTQERPDLIPKSDAVGEAAGLVVTATTYTWLAPRLKQLAPMLKELSEVASFEGLAKASEMQHVDAEVAVAAEEKA